MKLAIGILFLLGIVAAACAAFLVTGLNASTVQTRAVAATAEANPTVTVLYITRTVPAMTVVDGGLIESKQVPIAGAPAGYVGSSTDVLGKVLSRPLIAGEAFTKSCFAEMTGGKQLAGVIPPGKRAVGISITDYSALDGLIFPGSMVDVMVSFKDDSASSGHQDAITTTLVENVQVLAFEQQSVVSPGRTLPDLDISASRTGATRRVTLLVDTKQSKALELAMQQGTLSLALRNPLDTIEGDKDAVSVRSLLGDLTPISSTTPPAVATKGPDTSLFTSPPVPSDPASATPAAPQWETTVIRGSMVETQSFPMSSAVKQKPEFSKETVPAELEQTAKP